MAYYSKPAQYIDMQLINKDRLATGSYRHHQDWVWAYEPWAKNARIQYPGRQTGWVPHFKIVNIETGDQYRVYMNEKYGYFEAVPNGALPRGFFR